MKVFVSWSGDVSKTVALVLRDWLPSVIQAIEPYVSSEDIEKGTRWGQDLGEALGSLGVGILCLTPENVTAPWINFEAGALSKSLDNSRVMPFLLGMNKSQVPWPLAQFQLTSYEKDDVKRMLLSINGTCDSPPCVSEVILNRSFERWWPDLKESLDSLVDEAKNLDHGAQPARRVDTGAILEELLELTRDQHRILAMQERPLTDKDLERIAVYLRGAMRDRLGSRSEEREVRDAIEYARDHALTLSRRLVSGDLTTEDLRGELDRLDAPLTYALRRVGGAGLESRRRQDELERLERQRRLLAAEAVDATTGAKVSE
jgi:hypothetical protein